MGAAFALKFFSAPVPEVAITDNSDTASTVVRQDTAETMQEGVNTAIQSSAIVIDDQNELNPFSVDLQNAGGSTKEEPSIHENVDARGNSTAEVCSNGSGGSGA